MNTEYVFKNIWQTSHKRFQIQLIKQFFKSGQKGEKEGESYIIFLSSLNKWRLRFKSFPNNIRKTLAEFLKHIFVCLLCCLATWSLQSDYFSLTFTAFFSKNYRNKYQLLIKITKNVHDSYVDALKYTNLSAQCSENPAMMARTLFNLK